MNSDEDIDESGKQEKDTCPHWTQQAKNIGATEIVKDVYEDAIKEPLTEISKAITKVAIALNITLDKIGNGLQSIPEFCKSLESKLSDKLRNVPPERIEPPPIRIARPLIEEMFNTQEEPVIQDMFAQLLANSMNIDKRDACHPSFVDTVKNLAPIEASFLRFIARQIKARHILKIASSNHKKVFTKRNPGAIFDHMHPDFGDSRKESLADAINFVRSEKQKIPLMFSTPIDNLSSIEVEYDHPEPDSELLIRELKHHFLEKYCCDSELIKNFNEVNLHNLQRLQLIRVAQHSIFCKPDFEASFLGKPYRVRNLHINHYTQEFLNATMPDWDD